MDDAALLAEALPVIADWYARNRRPLPWREDPEPYRVWVSEITRPFSDTYSLRKASVTRRSRSA